MRPPVSGPGCFGWFGAFARRAAIFFFVVTTVWSGVLALGKPLAEAFEIGVVCGTVVAFIVLFATIVHVFESTHYEHELLARIGASLAVRWREETLVRWTATLLPAARSGGIYVGRDLVFVSHERSRAVTFPEDILVTVPLSEIASVETGAPRSLLEWLRTGSQTVEIILRNGDVIRVGAIAPRSLASALRDALRERGREREREGNDRERERERERERTR